jgi:molybdopterin biosynthesis enzyme
MPAASKEPTLRELIKSAMDVAGLVVLATAAAVGANDVAGAAAGCGAGGVALLAGAAAFEWLG